eukprot:CAMPEP_0194519696 /NCGR_PEP_ID=MMETSP0253-20130528/53407_1 /TAXON_ID=2966 /ORGANISM="Noctiluca scintillans" /LENGTH=68 /DNA_ID=CAMNT_0039363855 /DNA_START=52 /DNA_END=255 /DNA_ORIENTATION=+
MVASMQRRAVPFVRQSSPSVGAVGSRYAPPRFCEVWARNFDEEIDALLERAARPGAIVGLDMEFPGFV